MHLSSEAIRAAVYGAVADVNESLPADRRLPLDGSLEVFAAIDSLGALNLLLRIEERLGASAGVGCDLLASDVYETTLLRARTLDDLVARIQASLNGQAS